MSDSRFSGPAAPAGGDAYGYFGAPVPIGPLPAFGDPVVPPQAAHATVPSRRPFPLVPAVVALVAVVAVGGGAWWWTHRDDIALPDRLGTLSRTEDPSADSAMAAVRDAANERLGSQGKVGAAMYGSVGSEQAYAVVAKGSATDPSRMNLPAGTKGVSTFGATSCLTSGTYVVCLRGDGDVGVAVMVTDPTKAPDAATVAGWVDQVFAAQ